MNQESRIPDRKGGKLAMTLVDGDSGDMDVMRVFAHVNGTNAIFKGQLLLDTSCNLRNETLCSKFKISWRKFEFKQRPNYYNTYLDR